jgi:predicted protein tyrosine phosphatase
MPSQVLPWLSVASREDAQAALDDGWPVVYTHVLSLLKERSPGLAAPCKCLELNLEDSPQADVRAALLEAIPFLDAARHEGGQVLVHCSKGQSRSPCVIMAYLLVAEGLSFSAARDLVVEKHPSTRVNVHFLDQLKLVEMDREELVHLVAEPVRPQAIPSPPQERRGRRNVYGSFPSAAARDRRRDRRCDRCNAADSPRRAKSPRRTPNCDRRDLRVTEGPDRRRMCVGPGPPGL